MSEFERDGVWFEGGRERKRERERERERGGREREGERAFGNV